MSDAVGAVVNAVTEILKGYRDDLQQAANRRNQLQAAAISSRPQPKQMQPTAEAVKGVTYREAMAFDQPRHDQNREPIPSVSTSESYSFSDPHAGQPPAAGESLGAIPQGRSLAAGAQDAYRPAIPQGSSYGDVLGRTNPVGSNAYFQGGNPAGAMPPTEQQQPNAGINYGDYAKLASQVVGLFGGGGRTIVTQGQRVQPQGEYVPTATRYLDAMKRRRGGY